MSDWRLFRKKSIYFTRRIYRFSVLHIRRELCSRTRYLGRETRKWRREWRREILAKEKCLEVTQEACRNNRESLVCLQKNRWFASPAKSWSLEPVSSQGSLLFSTRTLSQLASSPRKSMTKEEEEDCQDSLDNDVSSCCCCRRRLFFHRRWRRQWLPLPDFTFQIKTQVILFVTSSSTSWLVVYSSSFFIMIMQHFNDLLLHCLENTNQVHRRILRKQRQQRFCRRSIDFLAISCNLDCFVLIVRVSQMICFSKIDAFLANPIEFKETVVKSLSRRNPSKFSFVEK